LISNPEYYRKKYQSPWEDDPYSCILSANRPFVTNTWQKHQLQPEQLLVAPQIWTTLDYTTVTEPNINSTLNWMIDRSGIVHGIGVWFDASLFEGIGFSNAPDKPECIYGNAFFPLSTPVYLASGDRVSVTLQANLIGDDYIWSWQTCITSGDDPIQVKANFQQSSFFGVPLSPQTLRKYSDSYTPVLNEAGKIDEIVLNLMSEAKSLGDIARQLTQKFPQRFSTWRAALSYASEFSQRYDNNF
jgi:type I protein arginine methyltransferase